MIDSKRIDQCDKLKKYLDHLRGNIDDLIEKIQHYEEDWWWTLERLVFSLQSEVEELRFQQSALSKVLALIASGGHET